MNLQLIRYCYGPDHVAGLLKFGDQLQHSVWSLECPWRDNQPFTSCIPDGSYAVVAFDADNHPDCWVLTPVPDRNGILIHVGNEVSDTQGCILIGQTETPGKVWNSLDALRQLNFFLNRNEQHVITIGSGLGAQLMPPERPHGVPSEGEQGNGGSEVYPDGPNDPKPPPSPGSTD